MKKLALKSALSAKLAAGDLILLEGLMLEEISTRRFAAVVRAFQLSGSVLFAVAEPDEKLRLSARNLPEVEVIAARELNPYRVLACKKLLLSRDGVAALEEIAT